LDGVVIEIRNGVWSCETSPLLLLSTEGVWLVQMFFVRWEEHPFFIGGQSRDRVVNHPSFLSSFSDWSNRCLFRAVGHTVKLSPNSLLFVSIVSLSLCLLLLVEPTTRSLCSNTGAEEEPAANFFATDFAVLERERCGMVGVRRSKLSNCKGGGPPSEVVEEEEEEEDLVEDDLVGEQV